MSDSSTPVANPETIEDLGASIGDGLEARVIVYNCDCHTYHQVIKLFCEIIPGMSSERAFELAWRIDHEGQAAVFSGDWETAEQIGKRLAAGGLRVAVQ
ncbi:MAG: ATP-dependent Clp protease adaptor ClpS [Nitrospiraceae bacterium]